MTILIVLWAIFAHLGLTTIELEKSVIWYRLNWGVVSLFFIAAYFFSIYFPRKDRSNPILGQVVVFLGIALFSLSVFTNLIIKNVILKPWGADIVFGQGQYFFYIISTILTFIIFYNLFKRYFILTKQEKLKVQYFLIGIFLFAGFNFIFNIILPFWRDTSQFYQIGDYSLIFFLGFTAFAIVKRQLFEIKVVLTSLLVTLIAILLAVDLFVFTPQLSVQIFKGLALMIFLFFGYLLIKSVLREIKRREQLEQLSAQLSTANIELKKLDKAKSEFLSIASHQLRTPLTAIKGYISMIIEGSYGKLLREIKKPLKNVYQSNERLIRLVNDLLSLSKLEAGKLEFKPKLISLKEMISGIAKELRVSVQKKGLYLKVAKTSKLLPKIMADRDKLRQVILNIIDNAVKYTKKGGINIWLKKIDDKVQIKISDTGDGMSKKEIENLFQMFSRATAGNQLHIEGAGIGLYIAKKFIEMHNGEVWAESLGKGKGSTFYIELPINQ